MSKCMATQTSLKVKRDKILRFFTNFNGRHLGSKIIQCNDNRLPLSVIFAVCDYFK